MRMRHMAQKVDQPHPDDVIQFSIIELYKNLINKKHKKVLFAYSECSVGHGWYKLIVINKTSTERVLTMSCCPMIIAVWLPNFQHINEIIFKFVCFISTFQKFFFCLFIRLPVV